MINYQEKRLWTTLAMLAQPMTFLASLMLGPGFPSTYGLDGFLSKDFENRCSLLISVGIVEHYC